MKKPFILILFAVSILFGSFMFARYQVQSYGIDSNPFPIKCIPQKWPENTFAFQVEDMTKFSTVIVRLTKIDGNYEKRRGFLNSDRILTYEDGKQMNFICSYAYGEPLFVKIQPCVNDSICAGNYGETILVPNPLEASDSNGHKISMMSINPLGTDFLINFEGFQPNEVLQFTSKSCHENIQYDFPIGKNGAMMTYAPAVIGKTEGPFSINISNATTNLTLQHYWGKIAFTPNNKYSKLKNKFPEFFKEASVSHKYMGSSKFT